MTRCTTQPAKKILSLTLAIAITLGATVTATGCARSVDPHTGMKTSSINDPLEPVNRAVFTFNNALDIVLIEPVAYVYSTFVPPFAQTGIRNFMRNLRSPFLVANSLLQGNINGAGVATARFLINTTAGIGGLVDVAGMNGLAYQQEDLGQTLAVWGMGDGFYLVLPVIGPSSARDIIGTTAEAYGDPLRIWTHKTGRDWVYYTRNAVEGLDNRAQLLDAIADLRRNSLDYYAAVRSAYAQKRRALIHNENPDAPTTPVIPDYDE
ncbi:MAG: VacJ family lipoprotein [Alphaproteobacteria bacterium]|nr:VacJ family lipoprotein [Alphaproteobacteria bacterium]